MTNTIILDYLSVYDISPDLFEKHLNNEADVLPHDGSLLTDYELFESALNQLKNKVVVIFSDYDCDGVAGGEVGKVGLDLLNITKETHLYYPDRSMGYGLSIAAVDDILEKYPDVDVILTIDNGIAIKKASDYAVSKGLEVIVTDHHKAKDNGIDFPDSASLVVNPNRKDKEETYPFKAISGTTVIWKLLLAYSKRNKPEVYDYIANLIPFVGISVISDVMPVVDENRTLLKETIAVLRDHNWLHERITEVNVPESYVQAFNGLYQLIHTAISNGKLKNITEIDAKTIGFVIAPAINSSHRMKQTSAYAFEVFNSYTAEPAKFLYELNELRKDEVAEAMAVYTASVINKDMTNSSAIVYHMPTLRSGIAGLIANEILKLHKKPTVVLSGEGPSIGGSARSLKTHNLFDILTRIHTEHPEIFISFGGHESAAGLHLNKEHLKLFSKLLNAYSKEDLDNYLLTHAAESDDFINIKPFNPPSVKEIREALVIFNQLKPFSNEMPEPIFKVTFNLDDATTRLMGNKNQHIKFTLTNEFEVIIWNGASKYNGLNINQSDYVISVFGELGINSWMNKETIQITANSFEATELN